MKSNKPIRILQVVTIMNHGGIETMLMNYYRKIDRNKIQFDFIVHRKERGAYDDEIEKMGGRIYRFSSIRPGNYRKYFRELDTFFENNKDYKIVHAHINENSSFILRAAKKANIPIRIAHSHLSDLTLDYKIPFRLYGKSLMQENANRFFACSKQAGTWLFGRQCEEEKITVINNAIDVEQFIYNPIIRKNKRNDLGIKNQLVIGHIGRFNKQKNHSFLIEIFHNLIKRNDDVLLLLIGDGYLKGKVEKKVDELEIQSKVKFLGLRDDISDLLQAIDVFLFPSLFEGLPVALVEAQAAGIPCVVSDSVTNESDITGNIKFISLHSSAEEWANELLHIPKRRENTIELIKNNGYDTNTMSQWLEKFYKSEIEKSEIGAV